MRSSWEKTRRKNRGQSLSTLRGLVVLALAKDLNTSSTQSVRVREREAKAQEEAGNTDIARGRGRQDDEEEETMSMRDAHLLFNATPTISIIRFAVSLF